MEIITNLRSNIVVIIIDFQLKANNEFGDYINQCNGITKDPKMNNYLLVFLYANNGDLHNNLSKNFKEIIWYEKIGSIWNISCA